MVIALYNFNAKILIFRLIPNVYLIRKIHLIPRKKVENQTIHETLGKKYSLSHIGLINHSSIIAGQSSEKAISSVKPSILNEF